jgi:hypothetical protein
MVFLGARLYAERSLLLVELRLRMSAANRTRSAKACDLIERDIVLLLGLIVHCQSSPLEYHKAILKDAVERAHNIYNMARKGNGRKPL